MAYQLTVVTGLDEGTRFRVDADPVIVGRSPSAGVVLRDESVGWEHVTLRIEGDRLLVQNLSARGTKLKGKRIGDEERISVQDEIELSEGCKIRVDSQRGGGSGGSSAAVLAVVLVLLLILAGLGVVLVSSDDTTAKAPVTATHWRTAYTRLDERVETWVKEGRFPPEAQSVFRDAWRLESASNRKAAHERWTLLIKILLTLPSPAVEAGDRTVMEQAGPTPRALKVVMGYDTKSALDFAWESDAAHADAFAWFARSRQSKTKPQEG